MSKPKNFIDMTGQKIGRLKIIKRVYPNGHKGESRWEYICECGYTNISKGSHLRRSSSCPSCAENAGYLNKNKTHCPKGHAYTKNNIRPKYYKNGIGRRCITCQNEQISKWNNSIKGYITIRKWHLRKMRERIVNQLEELENGRRTV